MIDAYAAGLVDGEGCLSIPLSRGVTPTPRLDMGMGEKALTVLRQMQTEYGGTVRLSRPATGKWQAAWMWSMWGEDLRVSLERWMPHLRLKKDQALLLLRLYEVASLQPKTGKHQMRRVWTAEGIAQGMEIRAAIMSLNRKGPPESGDQTEEIARLVDAQWVTSQRDLFSAGYTRFSGHWPKSGTMRDGIISAQPSAVRPTKEIVSGSSGWTTPPVDDANNVTRASGSQQSLARDTHQWATPRARDTFQFGQVEPWGTPNSTDGKGGASTRTSPEDQRGELRHQIGGFGSPIGQTPSPTVEPMAPSDSFRKPPSRGLNPRFALWLQGFPTDWFDGVTVPKKPNRGRRHELAM